MGPLHEQLEGAQTILLCASSVGGGANGACVDLLDVAPPSELNVLWVSYTRAPDACLSTWRTHATGAPGQRAVLALGEQHRGAGAGEVAVEVVDDPGDLTGLGIAVSRYLEEWDGSTALCLDSLTALLQYVELETAYEFLHVLCERLYDADAVGHFHLDPAAHEERAVTAFASLVDARVTVSADGDPAVTTRN